METNTFYLLHAIAFWVCFLVSFANPVSFRNNFDNCNATYVGENGHACFPCAPGYYKIADCVQDGEQARCAPCGAGTFQPGCNVASTCAPCRTHCYERRQVIVEGCSRVADTVCRCGNGYYWDPEEGVCLVHVHHICKPGYGLIEKGTAETDTTCEQCIPGVSFSNVTSFEKCLNCTVCVKYNTTCSPDSDAVCILESSSSHEVNPQTDRTTETDTTCKQCRPEVSFPNETSLEKCLNCTVCLEYNTTCSPEFDAETNIPCTTKIVIAASILSFLELIVLIAYVYVRPKLKQWYTNRKEHHNNAAGPDKDRASKDNGQDEGEAMPLKKSDTDRDDDNEGETTPMQETDSRNAR